MYLFDKSFLKLAYNLGYVAASVRANRQDLAESTTNALYLKDREMALEFAKEINEEEKP